MATVILAKTHLGHSQLGQTLILATDTLTKYTLWPHKHFSPGLFGQTNIWATNIFARDISDIDVLATKINLSSTIYRYLFIDLVAEMSVAGQNVPG